ncbi:alpha/beta fold hydrolase [Massilia sp. PAMC28688]|uniref:esterase/lipase family protein n=1 Tax=Massilia sp. PAMC28688 TaxID=2861283 RepID=UPI0027D93306|nr:alpha/beta fold hydrolase [Massilia sp. PAMC28688]
MPRKKVIKESKVETAPGLVRLALEMRAPWELGMALASWPFTRVAPRGDNHPVLVFPGLAAGDVTTLVIRRFLKDLGYPAHAWEQGLNFGPRPGVLEACMERITELRQEFGRPVSLVGWSLGGVYARELAKIMPGDVRQVITLGSPFAGSPRATNAWRVYQLVSGEREIDEERFASLRQRPSVPTTSIFSRTDGVVAWQCSVEEETDLSENIEVHASHVGMGANPSALYAIADRLAQPEGQWQRFDRQAHTGLKKLLYRDPARASWPNPFFGFY